MIHLDYKDSRPIYEQVADRLKELMILGVLEEGRDAFCPISGSRTVHQPNTISVGLCGTGTEWLHLFGQGTGKLLWEASADSGNRKCRELEEKVADLAVEAKVLVWTKQHSSAWRRNSLEERKQYDERQPISTKKFDDILAVDHINAQIREGSVFGLIGTNGAGRSTFCGWRQVS